MSGPVACLESPRRLGFFGGSFDPPHLAHLAVARAAGQAFALDRVILAPTARQPLKSAGAGAPYADRLAMVRLLCESEISLPWRESFQTELLASDLDGMLPCGRPNYTVETLERLGALQPDAELFVIVGADALLGIRSWAEPDRLFELARWIVVSRPGFPLTQLDGLGLSPAQRERVSVLDDLALPVSATDLRSRLAQGDDCTGLLPPPVLRYIREHRLYGYA